MRELNLWETLYAVKQREGCDCRGVIALLRKLAPLTYDGAESRLCKAKAEGYVQFMRCTGWRMTAKGNTWYRQHGNQYEEQLTEAIVGAGM